MGEKVQGRLLIIGGAEDKDGECKILKKVVELLEKTAKSLVILTTATRLPKEVGTEYKRLFTELGLDKVEVINIESRKKANDKKIERKVQDAAGVFFTGGDQLRITSLLGGSKVAGALHQIYQQGSLIVGTSAGAAAMSDTMIVQGDNTETPKKCTLKMAPGMGLLEEVIIDQHFAQRGRIGRLLLAIAQNPYVLGVGIDEDTAILVESTGRFKVLGSQTVTIVDASEISHTNVSELHSNQPLGVSDIRLHVIPAGYQYDLESKQVIIPEDIQ
ncbi:MULTISPECIES: cyanophycinase [unclassified Candidatus Frackibacter]|uniref:cyanophycinase n=1 Tax=unclassified Candidatus Frackibacter TaxID=2648818 RepID=UPI0007931160|nr:MULTISPECIES: cyanophycinase [unclassified Candidatus Frackibacter]KXS44497.1 MAG: cyanophycinase [Candidatus Frackibacter sp. T328-2]SDC66077.1 cyanophycinase [Candidatus Frackibacter sp. WG11]SEM79207.1 cyanophycinase [Candidatus Frackibacter sp. WG12]SFL89993.1 cyanophycinase [Candidatus Frackibacter sp. WG13]